MLFTLGFHRRERRLGVRLKVNFKLAFEEKEESGMTRSKSKVKGT